MCDSLYIKQEMNDHLQQWLLSGKVSLSDFSQNLRLYYGEALYVTALRAVRDRQNVRGYVETLTLYAKDYLSCGREDLESEARIGSRCWYWLTMIEEGMVQFKAEEEMSQFFQEYKKLYPREFKRFGL